MNYLEAILLRACTGAEQFLPISSSGHLVIFQQLFGLSEDIAANMLFDVLVHIGTLVAVFIAFRHRIWRLIKGGRRPCGRPVPRPLLLQKRRTRTNAWSSSC